MYWYVFFLFLYFILCFFLCFPPFSLFSPTITTTIPLLSLSSLTASNRSSLCNSRRSLQSPSLFRQPSSPFTAPPPSLSLLFNPLGFSTLPSPPFSSPTIYSTTTIPLRAQHHHHTSPSQIYWYLTSPHTTPE